MPAHKTKVLTFRFFGYDKLGLSRYRPDLLLRECCQGEEHLPQRLVRNHVKKIRLVLGPVFRPLQKKTPFLHDVCVMPGGNIIKTKGRGLFQKTAEFQVAVAVDTWIRRPSPTVFGDKLADDLLFKLPGKIEHIMGDMELFTDAPRIIYGVKAAAARLASASGTEAHGDARHFIT